MKTCFQTFSKSKIKFISLVTFANKATHLTVILSNWKSHSMTDQNSPNLIKKLHNFTQLFTKLQSKTYVFYIL